MIFFNIQILHSDWLSGHLHDNDIIQPRPAYLRVLLSCANKDFRYLNLAGITKFKYERQDEKDSGCTGEVTP